MVAKLRRSGFELSWERLQTEEEYLAALADPPEIVLAGYSLPQFSGSRALELQQMGPGIPFVVVSGTVGEEAAAAIIKRGVTDSVLKSSLARLGPAASVAPLRPPEVLPPQRTITTRNFRRRVFSVDANR
jgi:DNA-binding NtrC family response regulator